MTRFIVQFLAAAIFSLGLLTSVLMWQLAEGPIRLNFITPYVEAALNPPNGSFEVRLSHVILAWADWDRALDIRVVDCQVIGPDGRLLAEVPELSLALSARALFRGILAPTNLDIIGARLHVFRAKDGGLHLGLGAAGEEGIQPGDATDLARSFLSELMRATDSSNAMGYISRVSVLDAQLYVEDRDRNIFWKAPDASITLTRDSNGIRGHARLKIVTETEHGEFDVSSMYSAATGNLDLALAFQDVTPTLLATIEPVIGGIQRLNVPLSGTIAVNFDNNFQPNSVAFDLDGGVGTMTLPEYYAEPIQLQALELMGSLTDGGDHLAVENAFIDFGGPALGVQGVARRAEGTYGFELNANLIDVPVNVVDNLWPESGSQSARDWVMSNMQNGILERATVRLSGNAPTVNLTTIAITVLAIDDAFIDLGGPTLGVQAVARRTESAYVFELNANLIDVPVNVVDNLWPESGSQSARDWVMSNMQNGILERATVRLSGNAPTVNLTTIAITVLAIDDAFIDLGGPTLGVQAVARRTESAYVFELNANLVDAPINMMGTLWPDGVGPRARDWVMGNVQDGIVEHATLHLSGDALIEDLTAIVVTDFSGEIEADGMSVHYLRPMPPVNDARGRAVFDSNHFFITVESATLNSLRVESGKIDLVDLDEESKWANIDLTIAGPVLDAMRLIDEPPLQYVTKFGLSMAGLEGRQRTKLVIRVPLNKVVRLSEVEVVVSTSITDFAAKRVAFGKAARDGRLTLQVDKNQMSVHGDLVVAGTPVKADWHYNFGNTAEFRSRLKMSGILNNEGRLQTALAAVPFVEGGLGVDLTYTEFDGALVMGVMQLDLTDAAIDLQGTGWRKETGIAGRGYAEFIVENGQLSRIPVFNIETADLIAKGTVEFRQGAESPVTKRVAFQNLNFGDNNVYGTVDFATDGSYDVLLTGASLDLRGLFDWQDSQDGPQEREFPAFSLTINPIAPIARVRLSEDVSITHVRGALFHDGQDWRTATIDGVLSGGGVLSVRLTEGEGRRDLNFVAEDAGTFLRATKFHNQIEDGRLEVEGAYDDQLPGKPFVGFAKITDFRLHNAPVLAQILTLSSLIGILDTLSGDGIAFSRLEMPFRLEEDRLEITSAKARGTALGITGQGVIDWQTDEIAFAGDLVPAYGINGALSKIPLIGQLLAGGQDGIFVAAYKVSGPIDEPEVTAYPLTVLTPGIVRSIFKLFDRPLPPESEALPGDLRNNR